MSVAGLFLLVCLTVIAGCQKQEKPAPQNQTANQTPSVRKPPPPVSALADAVTAFDSGATGDRLDKSIALFRQFSYGNDPQAQYYLGQAHFSGRGVEQSNLEAYYWWTIAARNGNADAAGRIKDASKIFDQDELDEIRNRADDWQEHVHVTPELN